MSTLSPATVATIRQTAMDRLAATESEAWADFLFEQFETEGRVIEGGWPGTISEARRRLMTCLAANPEHAPLDRGETDRLVDALYRQAKQHWLRVSRG